MLVIYNDGTYEITDQELTQRFDADKIIEIEKFEPEKTVTAIYLDNDKMQFNVKRFKIETTTLHNKFLFIKEGEGNRLEAIDNRSGTGCTDQIRQGCPGQNTKNQSQ